LGIYQPCNSKTKKSLLNSQLIPKNRENPPPPNDLLSKGGRIADIKASAKASGKTTVCIVLKQRSNSGYYGQVCYLEKQMAQSRRLDLPRVLPHSDLNAAYYRYCFQTLRRFFSE